MAQAVRRSPPTAGVPSSGLGPSMWVLWWTKRGLGRFSRGFSRFPIPQISFHHFSTLISPIFRFISYALVMVRQAWSAGTLATHGPVIWGLHRISSHDPTLCWTRVEDIYKKCELSHCVPHTVQSETVLFFPIHNIIFRIIIYLFNQNK